MRKEFYLLCALTACDPMVSHRGHVPDEMLQENIEVGMSEQDVLRRFGSPSSRSSFGTPTWYYIQARKEAHAFFIPEVTEQKVIAVTFDSGGAVAQVTNYDKSDSQQVVMIDDITPTEGHSIGFFEQVLGNLGRFNNTGGGGGAGGTRGPSPIGGAGL